MQNTCIIAGRVALDVESKVTNGGKNFVKNRLACRRDYANGQDENGKKQYETDWINIVCWGKTAEYFASKIKKGDLVEINGRLQSNEYTDQNGQKKTTHEINFDQFYILESKSGSNSGTNQPQQANFSQPAQQPVQQNGFGTQQPSFGNPPQTQPQQNYNAGFGAQQPQQNNQPAQPSYNNNGYFPSNNGGGNFGFNNPNNFPANNAGGFGQPTNFNQPTNFR